MLIEEAVSKGNIEEIRKQVKANEKAVEYAKEYEENARDLRDTQIGKQPPKLNKKKEPVKTNKIPVPFQYDIVMTAAAFLFGCPVKVTGPVDQDIQPILDLWDEAKLDSSFLKFAEKVKSETEAAIVIFGVKKKDGTIKVKSKVLSSENGKLYPIFDSYGDMLAFGWEYKTQIEGKPTDIFRLYTDEKNAVYQKGDKGWVENKEMSKPNVCKKITVVYQSQKKPDWYRVKELIDRYELNLSKFADTNDYFSRPKYAAKGGVTTSPDPDNDILKLEVTETENNNIIDADLKVISWDRAPEALKLEFETIKELIYSLSKTPDLSFNNLKGISNISGVALKFMFLGTILRAKFDEGSYRDSVLRCLSVLTAFSNNVNLSLVGKVKAILSPDKKPLKFKVHFTSVLPENTKEILEMLSTATGGGNVMSQKTAVANNPLVSNVDEEINQIEEESKNDLMELTD